MELKRDLMGNPEPVAELLEGTEQFLTRLPFKAVGSKQDVGVRSHQTRPECGRDRFPARRIVGRELVTQACHDTHPTDVRVSGGI